MSWGSSSGTWARAARSIWTARSSGRMDVQRALDGAADGRAGGGDENGFGHGISWGGVGAGQWAGARPAARVPAGPRGRRAAGAPGTVMPSSCRKAAQHPEPLPRRLERGGHGGERGGDGGRPEAGGQELLVRPRPGGPRAATGSRRPARADRPPTSSRWDPSHDRRATTPSPGYDEVSCPMRIAAVIPRPRPSSSSGGARSDASTSPRRARRTARARRPPRRRRTARAAAQRRHHRVRHDREPVRRRVHGQPDDVGLLHRGQARAGASGPGPSSSRSGPPRRCRSRPRSTRAGCRWR